MDQKERVNELEEAIRTAMSGALAETWTALPAIVQDYDPKKLTCSARPSIKAQVTDKDGNKSWTTLPLLVDVPVVFPRGGGVTLTFPISQGDEVLIVFSCRCIDSWWANGGTQNQAELRMHDLSDGIAIPGLCSIPRIISGVSNTSAQLRSDDGSCFVEVSPSGTLNLTGPNGITIKGPITVQGNIDMTGNLTASGEGTFNGHTVTQHTHADPQGGVTTPPQG